MNTLVALRLPKETLVAIEEISKEKGRLSSQEVIREAIGEYLKRHRTEVALRELDQLAGSLKGKTHQLTRTERDAIFSQYSKDQERALAFAEFASKRGQTTAVPTLDRMAGSLKGKTRELTNEERDELARQLTARHSTPRSKKHTTK